MSDDSKLLELVEEVGIKLHQLTEQLKDTESDIGTLTFRLPENESAMKVAMNGNKYLLVLWELDQWCRNLLKYEGEDISAHRGGPDNDYFIYLEDLRTKLREMMDENGVSLEDGE